MRKLLLLLLLATSITTRAQDSLGKRMEVYGFVMVDGGFNFDQMNPQWFDVARPTQLPSYKNEYGTNGNIFFSVRQTRLGFNFYDVAPKSEIHGRFEFDLFGVGANVGETTFHLRQAYIEYKRWTVGQTWSPFINPDVAPITLDFWGPTGMVFYRNIQLRYSAIRNQHHLLNLALERPGATADEGIYQGYIGLQNVKPLFRYPDFSVEYRRMYSKGFLEVAGILREIGWRDIADDGYDLNGDALARGATISSVYQVTKNNTFKAQILYGCGIESCMNDAPADIGVREIGDSLSNRPLEGYALPTFGYFLALEHSWNNKLSSSFAYSNVIIKNSATSLPGTFREGSYAMANLLYYPTEHLMCGVEFQYAYRQNQAVLNDFIESSMRKIQVSIRYDFGQTWK